MKHAEPLISVIIPVYNMELYLARCLDSIQANSYTNLEIICIDDGSKDRSLEILRNYAEKDSRIVVIAKENGGVSSARNVGLDRMTGEFVTFVDPDDFVHPQYFEILLAARDISGADAIFGAFQHTNNLDMPAVFPNCTLTEQDVQVMPVTVASRFGSVNAGVFSRLIRCSAIGKIRFPEEYSYGEDTLFSLELLYQNPTMKVGLIKHEIYYYFLGRSDSLVQTGRDRFILPYLSVLAENASVQEKEPIYLNVLIRRGLYFRYYYTFVQKERQLSQSIGKLLRKRIGQLLRSRNFSIPFKTLRTLFILSPRIDRLYRFNRNPGLKRTEQIQKWKLAENT